MKLFKTLAFLLLLSCFSTRVALCQVAESATGSTLRLSAFAAGTGTYTGFNGGHNLGITAGADLGFRAFHGFAPSAEVRGTYPVVSGHVDSLEDILGGAKVEYPLGRWHPYGDFLAGRGYINYENGGYSVGQVLYNQTDSAIYSPGVGVDFDLTSRWAVKLDAQYQRWNTPVLAGGSFEAKVGSVGVVYRFGRR